MRRPIDASAVDQFFRALGRNAERSVSVYVTGGVSAVLEGWRLSTKDVDLKMVPDDDALLRRIPDLKEELQINVELAAPDDFIPPVPGWESRSRWIRSEGVVDFLHYDFYAQALAKLERSHAQDLDDVRQMRNRGLIEPRRLETFFDRIEPGLYRYPAIQPAAFRRQVEAFVSESDAT